MNKTIKGLIKSVNEKSGVISGAIASSEAVDRDGDILVASGWKLDNYRKNPVLLWSHNPFIPPIGKVTNIQIDGDKLVFDAELAVGVNELASEVFELMKAGVLKTFSVGYIPKLWDDQNRTIEMELLEISVVSIPANPDASVTEQVRHVEAVATKMAKAGKHKSMDGMREKMTQMQSQMDGMQTTMNEMRDEMDDMDEGGDSNKAHGAKIGREISSKNRSLIETAVDGMEQATGALKGILKAIDEDKSAHVPPPIVEGKPKSAKPIKGEKKEIYRALRLADKALGHALHTIKSNSGSKGGV